jgi:hypothetical protein
LQILDEKLSGFDRACATNGSVHGVAQPWTKMTCAAPADVPFAFRLRQMMYLHEINADSFTVAVLDQPGSQASRWVS